MSKRTYWHNPHINGNSELATAEMMAYKGDRVEEPDANLIASLTTAGTHMPVLDLDLPARLVPSSTPGHGHLYIDKEMSWDDAEKLLTVLCEVGIIEKGWAKASKLRGQMMVRKEGVMKQ